MNAVDQAILDAGFAEPRADAFLILRRGEAEQVVQAPFAAIAATLGVPLRPVLPWREWTSIDGDLSLIRYVPAEVAR